MSREAHLAAIDEALAKRQALADKLSALEPEWLAFIGYLTREVVGETQHNLPEGRSIQDMQRHPMGMGALLGRLEHMKLQLEAMRALV